MLLLIMADSKPIANGINGSGSSWAPLSFSELASSLPMCPLNHLSSRIVYLQQLQRLVALVYHVVIECKQNSCRIKI